MQDIIDKVKSTVIKGADAVVKGADTVVGKGNQLIDAARLRNERASLEKDLMETYESIGKVCCDMVDNDCIQLEVLQSWRKTVKHLQDMINDNIEMEKNVKEGK